MTEHIYGHEHPDSGRTRGGGLCLWFTGLSGSGKTTIAHLVGPELDQRGAIVEYLDGDTVRTHLSKGLGFSKEDRDTNIERIGWVASRLVRHGAAVICAAISPYEETRRKARELVEPSGPFIEVYVRASAARVLAKGQAIRGAQLAQESERGAGHARSVIPSPPDSGTARIPTDRRSRAGAPRRHPRRGALDPAQLAGGMWWLPLNRSLGSYSALTWRRRAQVSASKNLLASVGSMTKFG